MNINLDRYIGPTVLVKALLAMLFLTGIMRLFSLLVLGGYDLFERNSPTSRWFAYTKVEPAKLDWKKGETIVLLSEGIRYKSLEMKWYDTLYCDQGDMTVEYYTQYEPIEGTVYKAEGRIRRNWEYMGLIPENEHTCRICGIAVGYTPAGYKKTLNYCTSYFNVNL